LKPDNTGHFQVKWRRSLAWYVDQNQFPNLSTKYIIGNMDIEAFFFQMRAFVKLLEKHQFEYLIVNSIHKVFSEIYITTFVRNAKIVVLFF